MLKEGMCASCLILGKIYARGLDKGCYDFHLRLGNLDQLFPGRRYRSRADTLEDWEVLRGRGLGLRAASEVMGYAPKSLERILARARARTEDERTT